MGYVDDCQLYKRFKPSEGSIDLSHNMDSCISSVSHWMSANKLKLIPDKTEVVNFGTKRQLEKTNITSLNVDNTTIHISALARNLGCLLDSLMSMKQHIDQVCRSAWVHLHKIAKIRQYLDKTSTEMLVHAFITSRIDYCNSILYNLPESETKKLQRIQNVAARVVLSKKGDFSATKALKSLHWLPIRQRISFKILLLVFKTIHNQAPIYLKELINVKTITRSLRSSSHLMLQVPKYNFTKYGDRAFSVAGPKLWNSLPNHIKSSETVDCFKGRLKIFLFHEAFN
jgi:hypothetical protein